MSDSFTVIWHSGLPYAGILCLFPLMSHKPSVSRELNKVGPLLVKKQKACLAWVDAGREEKEEC